MANPQEPSVADLLARIDALSLALREVRDRVDTEQRGQEAKNNGFEQPPIARVPARQPLKAVRSHEEISLMGNQHSLQRPAFATGYPSFFNPRYVTYVQEILQARNGSAVRHEVLHLSCVASYMIDYTAYLNQLIAASTIADVATQTSLAVVASGFSRLCEMMTFRLSQLAVIAEGRDQGLALYAEEVLAPSLRRAPGISSAFSAVADSYRDKYSGALLKRVVQTATSSPPSRDRGQAPDNDGAGTSAGRRGGNQGGKGATRQGAATGTHGAKRASTSGAGGDLDPPAGQA